MKKKSLLPLLCLVPMLITGCEQRKKHQPAFKAKGNLIDADYFYDEILEKCETNVFMSSSFDDMPSFVAKADVKTYVKSEITRDGKRIGFAKSRTHVKAKVKCDITHGIAKSISSSSYQKKTKSDKNFVNKENSRDKDTYFIQRATRSGNTYLAIVNEDTKEWYGYEASPGVKYRDLFSQYMGSYVAQYASTAASFVITSNDIGQFYRHGNVYTFVISQYVDGLNISRDTYVDSIGQITFGNKDAVSITYYESLRTNHYCGEDDEYGQEGDTIKNEEITVIKASIKRRNLNLKERSLTTYKFKG